MESVKIQNADRAWHIADAAKNWPTIVAVHPFGSYKEQTSGNVYRKLLAEQGFIREHGQQVCTLIT